MDQSIYLPHLQEHLSYQIPELKASVLHLPSGGDIVGCHYPKISGNTLSKEEFHQRPLFQKITFFERLSGALSQLHDTPVDSLNHQFPTYLDYVAQFLFPKSPEKQPLFNQKIHQIFETNDIPLSYPLLCHTDLHPGNVVLGNKMEFVGIVDWDSLCMGDNFMEFHPLLYEDNDLQLFHEVYSETTHHPVNKKAVNCLANLHKNILFLCAFDAEVKQEAQKLNGKTTPSQKSDDSKILHPKQEFLSHTGRD